jgi:DNA-binding response OmpR family regulator
MPGASEDPHPIDSWGVYFPKAPRLMLAALYDAPGIVSNDRLYQIITAHRTGDLPEPGVIKVYIKKLRELVPAERGRIVTYWGRGYGFEKAEAGNV